MKSNNSLVYSVTYENYQNKIYHDKENKTQGNWNIHKDKVDELKFAYVYLKNSDKMIVKKYTVKHFERNDVSKGYDDIDKQCFVFEDSEDVFFEYPYGVIQGRHYRSDLDLDLVPRLSKEEIELRLTKSRNAKDRQYETKDRTSVIQDEKTRLRQVWKNEFSDRPLPPVEVAVKMIASVVTDPEQDLSALLDEYYTEVDKKKSTTEH